MGSEVASLYCVSGDLDFLQFPSISLEIVPFRLASSHGVPVNLVVEEAPRIGFERIVFR